MTEILHSNSESLRRSETQITLEPYARAAGNIALVPSGVAIERDLDLGGQICSTNLPAGINPFELPEEPKTSLNIERQKLNPTVFDQIPTGKFNVNSTKEVADEFFGPPQVTSVSRTIELIETPHGRAVMAESLSPSNDKNVSKDASQILENLGFVFASHEDGRLSIAAVPTPETFKSAALGAGLDVELLPGTAAIPGKEYLQYYANGKYPVATASEFYYTHDVGEDHVPAMVLGGPALAEALASATSLFLTEIDSQQAESGESLEAQIDRFALNIDQFTGIMSGVLIQSALKLGDVYCGSKGMQYYLASAAAVGITADKATAILAQAQQRANDFGIKAKDLTQ